MRFNPESWRTALRSMDMSHAISTTMSLSMRVLDQPGGGQGMTAADFDRSMRESLEINGLQRRSKLNQ